MSINFHKAFGLYESALGLRTARAQVLANNLANADTPNFKARDFDFHAALDRSMAAAKSGQGRAGHAAAVDPQLAYRVPSQPSIDGNTVDEHQEHSAYMANSLEYQVAFTMLNSRVKGLQKAIRGD